MIDLSILAFWCVLIISFLVIWFNSNALVEYARLLGLRKIILLDDFEKESGKILGLTYTDFLIIRKNCFFVRLISCPTCLAAWLCLFACLEIGFYYWPFLYIGSLIPYLVIKKNLFE